LLCGTPLSSGDHGQQPRHVALPSWGALSGRLAFASTGLGRSGSSRDALDSQASRQVRDVRARPTVAGSGGGRPSSSGHEASTSAPNSSQLFSPRASCPELVQCPMRAEVRVIGGQAKNRTDRCPLGGSPLGFLQEHPICPCDDAALLDPPLGGRLNGGRAASVHPADASARDGICAAGKTAVPPRRAAPSRPDACHQRPPVGTVA